MNSKPLMKLMVCSVAAVLLTVGAAYAQTADGQTPAVEDVCDPLAGAAFGLCNAYCEAMDCELLFDNDPATSPNASEVACLKVKDNFIKITGMPELPCEAIPCPPGTEDCPCLPDNTCLDGLVCSPENAVCVEEGNG